MLDRFSQSTKLFGLTISPEKTEVLHQPAPGGNNTAPVITIVSTQLVNVAIFRYLGSIISQDGTLDREVGARIGKASQALGRLRNRMLTHPQRTPVNESESVQCGNHPFIHQWMWILDTVLQEH